MASQGMPTYATLPGRRPGTYYDEGGNAVAVRPDVFNSLPASRRPRIYDHRGLRVLRMDTRPHATEVRHEPVETSDGTAMLVALWRGMVGVASLFLRIVFLLARLV